MIKVAFGSVPKDGGTFTFYRNQRPKLLKLGVAMRCVSVGRREARLIEPAYVDDGCVLLAETERDLKKQVMAFAEWCEDEQIDIVIGVNSEAILASLPHLPQRIRVVSRCANAFDEGYRYGTVCQERYAAMVALTPRLQKDLVENYGAKPDLFRLIPNGIDIDRFREAAAQVRGGGAVLELGFLGRLEHKQKGVLYLPKIVQHLQQMQVAFRLRIAGKGVHEPELRKALSQEIASGQVELLGQLNPEQIPAFLASVDVYLFTSHFEGCPNALLEAMVAGCVPVSWVIEGITDFLIEDGKTGALVPSGDCEGFAQKVQQLAQDRGALRTLQEQLVDEAQRRFASAKTAQAYAEMFHQLMAQAPPAWSPRPWTEFAVPLGFSKKEPSDSVQWIKIALKKFLN
ncbi:glycosyltransferase family 4 protein [Rubritalea marina]|uniref:glycosyltransferase family 4 protein n=1 Tax=Rubritalea marina TaxID=361055 RepID=UPI00036E9613|nr:glycosyltransferase family 4 protein [Rubritalea marina]